MTVLCIISIIIFIATYINIMWTMIEDKYISEIKWKIFLVSFLSFITFGIASNVINETTSGGDYMKEVNDKEMQQMPYGTIYSYPDWDIEGGYTINSQGDKCPEGLYLHGGKGLAHYSEDIIDNNGDPEGFGLTKDYYDGDEEFIVWEDKDIIRVIGKMLSSNSKVVLDAVSQMVHDKINTEAHQ